VTPSSPIVFTALVALLATAELAAQGPPATNGPEPRQAPASAPASPSAATNPPAPAPVRPADACTVSDVTLLRRNPTASELRCRYRAQGPGRFGLLSYLDVPVYQPRTPMPGTHVVGVPGMPRPAPGESYEAWEWRVLRTTYGPSVRNVYRGMELLDPVFASRVMRFERLLRQHGVRATRRETYRSAERQAWVFQQGRSRPGPLATTTLTSWHNRLDRAGRPAARAADYDVAPGHLPRFHALADSVGILGYGADSFDPGHVYLPDTDAATGMELAVLRLVPRVPHVTLETGRPFDEPQIPGMRSYWRDLEAEFAGSRLRPFPRLEPAARGAPPLRTAPSIPLEPRPQPPAPTRRRR
jgi:hypothetical protein